MDLIAGLGIANRETKSSRAGDEEVLFHNSKCDELLLLDRAKSLPPPHFHLTSEAQLRIKNDVPPPTRFEILRACARSWLATQPGTPQACGYESDVCNDRPDRWSSDTRLATSIPTAPTAARSTRRRWMGQCVHIASQTTNDCFRDSSSGGRVAYCIGCLIQSSFCPAHTIQPQLPL